MRILTLHQGVGGRVDTVEDDSTYSRNVRTEVPEKPHCAAYQVEPIANSSQTLAGGNIGGNQNCIPAAKKGAMGRAITGHKTVSFSLLSEAMRG